MFAVLFVFLGLIVVSLIVPVLFPGPDMRKLGATLFPVILVIFGATGFAFGYRRK